MSDDIWDVLGIEPTRDRDTIRRAYARKLRVTNPEDDAEGFVRLREAHDEAVARIDWDWMWEEEEGGEGDDGDLLERAAPLVTTEGPSPSIVTPSTENVELETRFERLEILLRGAERPSADALEAAFHAVLNAEALEEIALAAAVEDRVADLLLDTAPRSDPLLAPAIDAFRWRRDDLRFWPTPTAQAIIERADFVKSRDHMLKFDDYGAKAIELLRGTPTAKLSWLERLDPGYDRAMKTLLGRIGDDDSALMADFDRESVAAWRAYYDRARLSPTTVALVLGGPIVPALFGFGFHLGLLGVIGLYLGMVGMISGVWAARQFGYSRLKAQWNMRRSWRAGVWERIGWAPASLLLLPVAALAPDGMAGAGLIAAPCAAILLWCGVTTELDDGFLSLGSRLLAQIVPVAWVVSLSIFGANVVSPAIVVALATALVVDFRGAPSIAQAWHLEMNVVPRVLAVLALLAAAIATGVAVWNIHDGPQTAAPLCVAAVLMLAIGHRPAVAGVDEMTLRFRYYGMLAAFWIARGVDIDIGSWLTTSATWMLVGVFVGLVMSLYAENGRRTA